MSYQHLNSGLLLPTKPHRQRARWLILAWLGGLVLVLLSGLLQTAIGYVVILGACVFLGVVLGAPAGDTEGLKEHRQ
jgi:hypothetical protein